MSLNDFVPRIDWNCNL